MLIGEDRMRVTAGSRSNISFAFGGWMAASFLVLALVSCSSNDAEPDSRPITTWPLVITTNPSPPSTIETPATTVRDALATPRFEPGDCAAPVTLGFNHRCGHLVVPEDRSKPAERLVRLPVVIFEARANSPLPDPMIYLAGGGGVDQMGMMSAYRDMVAAVVPQRDFIMYNQRGAPRTEPELHCRGLEEILWELAGAPRALEERNSQLTGFWSDCRSDLVEQGIDLEMYSTAANAADADDLRIALGYEQANYYGTSYGTRIGLALLRDHPGGVRSIILDSVYPPEADYYTSYGSNVARALTDLFEECGSDPLCSDRYGNLEELFLRTVDRLDGDPAVITYPDGEVVVDGMMFIDVIYALLQSTPGRDAAASFIEAAAEGNLDPFEPVYPALFDYPGNMAVYYSFQCREEVPKHSFAEVVAESAGVFSRTDHYAVSWFAALDYAVCEVWGVQPSGASEAAPVVSDVPALVLAGAFDPITPAEWGRSATQYLTNGWFFELPGQSHGVMRTSACARDIALAFIDDPNTAPEPDCIGIPLPTE
jgi:pimeloyl-ACP methyl ester carboxylesterase